jgi:nicotinate-nucleotide adenylyltransferase
LKACDFEFHLPRPSYTYHTLQALRAAYPDCTFSLIIGEDNWQHFHRWYRSEDIARETPIIVYPRDAEGELRIKDKKARTPNSQQPIANSQQSPKLLPYSSTEVRHLIAQGEDASHMLHPEVYQYIKAKQLYTK